MTPDGSSVPTGSETLARLSSLSSGQRRSPKPKVITQTSLLAGVTRRFRCKPKRSRDCTRTTSSWQRSSTASPPTAHPEKPARRKGGNRADIHHSRKLDGPRRPEGQGLAAPARNRQKGPVRHGG